MKKRNERKDGRIRAKTGNVITVCFAGKSNERDQPVFPKSAIRQAPSERLSSPSLEQDLRRQCRVEALRICKGLFINPYGATVGVFLTGRLNEQNINCIADWLHAWAESKDDGRYSLPELIEGARSALKKRLLSLEGNSDFMD